MINLFKDLGECVLRKAGYYDIENDTKKRKLFLDFQTMVPMPRNEDDQVVNAISLDFDTKKRVFDFVLDKELSIENREYFFAFSVGSSNDKKNSYQQITCPVFIANLLQTRLFILKIDGLLGGFMTLIKLNDKKDKLYQADVYKSIIAQHATQTLEKKVYESKDFYNLSESYFSKFDFKAEATKLLAAIYNLNYDEKIERQTPISDFKLIQQYQEENIYILVTEQSQKDMEQFLKSKSNIFDKNLSKEERETYLFEIEMLKTVLKKYQISLRGKDLEEYNNTNIIIENDYFKYVSYDMQKEYLYDEEIGFLTKPKKEISPTINF